MPKQGDILNEITYVNSTAIVSYSDFRQQLLTHSSGVLLVKPRVFLERVESQFGIPVEMRMHVPSSKIGSILTLEATILACVLKLIRPSRVFEFGTFLGYTTAFLLNNSDAVVYSLDLPRHENEDSNVLAPDETKLLTDDAYNDHFLTAVASSKGEIYLAKLMQDSRLNLIKCDSRNFEPQSFSLNGRVDFIFIDGGHSHSIIESDTRKSLQMVSNKGVLIWHDFNSQVHNQVSHFLSSFSEKQLLIHVESTMLAIGGPGILNF